jgi:hypothetical protein
VAVGSDNPYDGGVMGIDDPSGSQRTDFDLVFRTFVAPMGSSLSIEFYAGITIEGIIGTTNRIEYVAHLGDTNWTTLTNIVLPQSRYLIFDPDSPRRARRFYRAVQLP